VRVARHAIVGSTFVLDAATRFLVAGATEACAHAFASQRLDPFLVPTRERLGHQLRNWSRTRERRRTTDTVAQHNVLRYDGCVPVATARKVEALRADFRSAAQLADMLGVSRSQVTRWLRGAGIDPLNAEKVDLLELVWSSLLRLYQREAALAWLFGINPRLGDRRPIDLVRAGRTEELMLAIRAERSDSFA